MRLANFCIVIIPITEKSLESIGGIRKLLYYTASVELVVEHPAGGNNFVRVVSDSNA